MIKKWRQFISDCETLFFTFHLSPYAPLRPFSIQIFESCPAEKPNTVYPQKLNLIIAVSSIQAMEIELTKPHRFW